MKRLVQVIFNKRDKSDKASTTSPANSVYGHGVAKSRSSFFLKAPKTPILTDLSSPGRPILLPGTSSASSDTSASLQTPEDDGPIIPKPLGKQRRWTMRRPGKSSEDLLAVRTPSPAGSQHPAVQVTDGFLGTLSNPHSAVPARFDAETEEDDISSESSESNAPESAPPLTHNRHAVSSPQIILATLIKNGLAPVATSHPLIDSPSSSRFPRSMNTSSRLPAVMTMEITMHKKTLLRRLERNELTRSEIASIASFGSRPKPALKRSSHLRTEEDVMSPDAAKLDPLSRGLRFWAFRPYFEERMSEWVEGPGGGLIQRNLSSARPEAGVANLEFSESLELLAGLELTDEAFENAVRTVYVNKKPTSLNHPRAKPSTFKSAPSPLRLYSSPPTPVLSPDSSRASRSSPTTPEIILTPTSPQREVRFVETAEKDDDIPLVYSLNKKKKLQEKARFLQAENERRAQERKDQEVKKRAQEEEERITERLAQEERQKVKRAQEAAAVRDRQRVQEEERVAREAERLAREDRQKAKYAEEVVAARYRREHQRGAESYSAIKDVHARDRDARNSRPAYDSSQSTPSVPRRPAESPQDAFQRRSDSPAYARQSNYGPSDAGRSRRGSVAASQAPTIHLPSESSRTPRYRRQSTVSDFSQHSWAPTDFVMKPGTFPRSLSTPYVGGWQYTYPYGVVVPTGIPPVPTVPLLWEMPLLPPTPAFMTQQYGYRTPSASSRDSSPSRYPATSQSSRESLPGPGPSPSAPRPSSRRPIREDGHASPKPPRRASFAPSSSPVQVSHRARTPVQVSSRENVAIAADKKRRTVAL